MRIQRKILGMAAVAACLLAASGDGAVASAPPAVPAAPTAKAVPCPSRVVTCVAADRRGGLWVGTEEQGLLYRPPLMGTFRRETMDGLGDDSVPAVAVDAAGRVWAGSRNHGVLVGCGGRWRRYSVGEGLPGERVFAIACAPLSGDVWIATSGGLARWRAGSRSWRMYTRRDGLPSDQVLSLAFDGRERIYAGTDCAGIAMSNPADDYGAWETASAPAGSAGTSSLPVSEGNGLPSNQINQLLVDRDDVVWAATAAGLAWSLDGGTSWKFRCNRSPVPKSGERGVVATAKKKGARKGGASSSASTKGQPLPDCVTALAEDGQGRLWVGMRTTGVLVLDRRTRRPLAATGAKGAGSDFVRALCPLSGGMVSGCFGGGLASMKMESANESAAAFAAPALLEEKVPEFPDNPALPGAAEIASAADWLSSRTEKMAPGTAAYLGEDWATRGDWCGRYGRRRAMLCAMNAPLGDHELGFDPSCRIAGLTGPNAKTGEALRHWIHWMWANQNTDVLYSPEIGGRREAEWDDHGEDYPMSFDGPDVWCVVKVPAGIHAVSLYFYNPNGLESLARFRDYLVEVRHHHSLLPEEVVLGLHFPEEFRRARDCRTVELRDVMQQPVLARTRVCNFHGGVYKTFAVSGPGLFYFRVGRNGSFNTILNGVFVDRLPEPAVDSARDGWAGLVFGDALPAPPPFVPAGVREEEVVPAQEARLWKAAEEAAVSREGAAALRCMRLLAYRSAVAKKADEALLQNWRWQLAVWDDGDRRRFWNGMMQAWECAQVRFPWMRSADFRPGSPNVVPRSVADLLLLQKTGGDWRKLVPNGYQPPKEGEIR